MGISLRFATAAAIAVNVCASTTAIRAADDEKPRYEIKVEEVKAQPTMTTRFEAAPEELAANYSRALGAVYAYVMSAGGEVAGPPFGWYHAMQDGKFDVETGLPVVKPLAERGEIKPSKLPGGMVATTTHVGPYDGLGDAHEALETWAREHGKKATAGPWESYITDPGNEPDPAKYRTKLFLPLEAENASTTE